MGQQQPYYGYDQGVPPPPRRRSAANIVFGTIAALFFGLLGLAVLGWLLGPQDEGPEEQVVEEPTADAVAEPAEAPAAVPTAPPYCDPVPDGIADLISAGMRDPSMRVEPYAVVDSTYFDPPLYLVAGHILRSDGSREISGEAWGLTSLRPDAEVVALSNGAVRLTVWPDGDTLFSSDPRDDLPDGRAFVIECLRPS